MKRVGLFYMIKRDNNKRKHGAAAFVVHLARGLQKNGYDPLIIRVSKGYRVKRGAGSAGGGSFGFGLQYANMDIAAACAFAKQFPSIIAAAHFQDYEDEMCALLDAKVPWVVHGQANVPDRDHVVAPHMTNAPIVAIRRTLQKVIDATHDLSSVFIPHPYDPLLQDGASILRARAPKKHHAVACSRIDFAKHTTVVIEANQCLPDAEKIQMFGDVNRMYAHHTLDTKYPGWRTDYRGEFDLGAGYDIVARANFAVDMSYWMNDRGGTQYTFFEAWDAGTPLILHQNWFDASEPTSDCALFVTGPEELAHTVIHAPRAEQLRAVENGRGLMHQHGAARVASRYAALW